MGLLLVALWVIVLPGVGFWGLYFLWSSIIYDCWVCGWSVVSGICLLCLEFAGLRLSWVFV